MRALESWKRRLWFRFPFTPVVSSLVRLSPAARPDGRNLHVAASECQGGCSISVWIELLTHGVQRSLCAARNDIDAGRVRTNKQSVWLARIERERPNSLTWQTVLTRVDSRPRQSGISRTINAAADLAVLIVLISVAGKNLVGVARIDQNAGEISKGKISTAARPMLATVVRLIKGLLGSHVNESRAFRILHDDIDWRSVGN